jgi:hypothetical protein
MVILIIRRVDDSDELECTLRSICCSLKLVGKKVEQQSVGTRNSM